MMQLLKCICDFIYGKVLKIDVWMRYRISSNKDLALVIEESSRLARIEQIRSRMGFIDKSAYLGDPFVMTCPQKVYMYKNSHIYENAKFIISTYGEGGRFILGENSGCAQGLTVVTGNHNRIVGSIFKELTQSEWDVDKDIVVDEDVLIASNVTLLAGVHVGRGATLGSGSVVRCNVPPYSIVMGNPAKVVGFSFSPEQVKEHENILYADGKKIDYKKYEETYNKFFVERMSEIRKYSKLQLS